MMDEKDLDSPSGGNELLFSQLRGCAAGVNGNTKLLRDELVALRSKLGTQAGEFARVFELLNDLSAASDGLCFLVDGTVKFAARPLDLAILVQDAKGTLEPKATAKGVKVHVGVLGAARFVNTDLSLTRKMLITLLGNAIQFTNEGGSVDLNVSVLSKTAEEIVLQIVVSDTGSGMTEEEVGSLFKVFSQESDMMPATLAARSVSPTPISVAGDSGSSLYFVRKILDQIGGKIDCNSTEGSGSVFTICLPCGVVTREECAKLFNQKRAGRSLSSQSSDPHRILIVDDDGINRKLLMRICGDLGHECHFAENGADAVRLFCEYTYDVVFMDIMMPVMGGLEATEEIRRIEKVLGIAKEDQVPIIGLSGNVGEEDSERGMQAGMTDYVGKPYIPGFIAYLIRCHALPLKMGDNGSGERSFIDLLAYKNATNLPEKPESTCKFEFKLKPLPSDLLLSKEGTGARHSREASYPKGNSLAKPEGHSDEEALSTAQKGGAAATVV